MNLQYKSLIQACLRFISIRDRSWLEIDQYLARHNPDPELIQQIKDYLKTHDLVNDERFGQMWAEFRVHHSKGDVQILQELKRKGLDLELCHQIIDQIDSSACTKSMSDLLAKKSRAFIHLNNYQKKAKIYQLFSQHGYSAKLIDAFLRRGVEYALLEIN